MRNLFTPEEDAIILSKSHKEACQLLPNRKPNVIATHRYTLKNRHREQGKRLGKFTADETLRLRRYYPVMSNADLQKEHFPDRSIGCLMRKARYMGLRKKTPPAPTIDGHNEIVHQIISDAKRLGITLGWLDKLCGTGNYFLGDWRRLPVNLAAVARAVELLGGKLIYSSSVEAVDAKKLLSCVMRFGNEAAPKLKRRAKQDAPQLKLQMLRPSQDAQIRRALSAMLPRTEATEDVIQMIMLAIYEGRCTLEDLRGNRYLIRDFFRSYFRDNHERSGYSISLDAPMPNGRSRYDSLEAFEDVKSADE